VAGSGENEQEATADKPEEGQRQQVRRSSWTLVEREEFTQDIKEYKRRRRQALLEALVDLREGQRHMSGRVITIWAYQRGERWKAG
jgi:hypothetical protein